MDGGVNIYIPDMSSISTWVAWSSEMSFDFKIASVTGDSSAIFAVKAWCLSRRNIS